MSNRVDPNDDSSLLSSSLSSATLSHTDSSSERDNILWGEVSSMKTIRKSPYEPPMESAEVGETEFEEVKLLLLPSRNDNESVHPMAKRLFGNRLAESLVTASTEIGKSGMLFSPSWTEGKIRGVQCGWIPKAYLLLCLHEQRFIRADNALLQSVIKDLGCTKIVGDALSEWDLDHEFINLSSNATTYVYTKKKSDCLRCEIFVARAFRSVKALKRQMPERDLMKKIKVCLKIMNDYVKVNQNNVAKRLQELEEENNPIVAPKKKTPAPAKKSMQIANNGGKRKRIQEKDSIEALMGMFEEHSRQMQEILSIIRRKLAADKESIRQEVRQELMEHFVGQNGKKRKSH